MTKFAIPILCFLQFATAQTPAIRTTYVPLGTGADATVYEPAAANPKSRTSLIYAHPSGNNFNHPIGRELASRGYRVLMLNTYGTAESFEAYAPSIAAAIRHLRGLPGVAKVVFVTHSGGGPVMTFYQNVAQNGARACQGP